MYFVSLFLGPTFTKAKTKQQEIDGWTQCWPFPMQHHRKAIGAAAINPTIHQFKNDFHTANHCHFESHLFVCFFVRNLINILMDWKIKVLFRVRLFVFFAQRNYRNCFQPLVAIGVWIEINWYRLSSMAFLNNFYTF